MAWKLRLGQSQQQQNPQAQQQPQVKGPPTSLPRQPYPPPPAVEIRYGPFAQPLWSKVAGPTVISGMKRWKKKNCYHFFFPLRFFFSFLISFSVGRQQIYSNSPKLLFSMSTLSSGWSYRWILFMTSDCCLFGIHCHHGKTSTPEQRSIRICTSGPVIFLS